MAQDPRGRVRAEARRLLAAGVSGQVFPGAVACVAWRDPGGQERRVVAVSGLCAPGGERVVEGTFYDLGAITRCVVAVAALRASARGAVDLDAEVETLLPHVRGGVLEGVTLRRLFEHTAGLARWGGLYLDVPHEPGSPAARRWILSEAARRPGERVKGEVEPSDLGYLIAGEALARACRSTLAEVVVNEVLDPLGITEQVLYAGALPSDRRTTLAARSAPTENCAWRGRLLEGEVQDENAAALGGVAGHAGIFGTAAGVATFGGALLEVLGGRSKLLARKVLEQVLASSEAEHRFGFLTKAGASPPCGRRMGAATIGQLGFPGTSMFLDPERETVIVLLTNRICPSRANNKIEGFRPAFHDGVMAAIAS